MSVVASEHRRPLGVTLVVVVMSIQAVAAIVFGAIFVLGRNSQDVLDAVDWSSTQIAAAGVALVAAGVVAALLAVALGRGSNIARYLVGALALVSVASAVWGVIQWSGEAQTNGIAQGFAGVFALVLLFSGKANEYFNGREKHFFDVR